MRRITLPPLRRPAQTVIWGGRLDLDRWVGSSHDLRMEAIANYFAALERRRARRVELRGFSSLAAELSRVSAAIGRLGITATQARENVLALAEADRRRQERIRTAGQRAERALGGLSRDQARALLGLPREGDR